MIINEDSTVTGGNPAEAQNYGIVLPQQYYGVVAGAGHNDGARDLMLAVLEDAIRTYLTNRMGKTARHRRLFDEVKGWIDTRGGQDPFSFETICETFDIDPDDLRRQISNLSPENFRRRVRNPKRSRMVKAA